MNAFPGTQTLRLPPPFIFSLFHRIENCSNRMHHQKHKNTIWRGSVWFLIRLCIRFSRKKIVDGNTILLASLAGFQALDEIPISMDHYICNRWRQRFGTFVLGNWNFFELWCLACLLKFEEWFICEKPMIEEVISVLANSGRKGWYRTRPMPIFKFSWFRNFDYAPTHQHIQYDYAMRRHKTLVWFWRDKQWS